MKLISIIIPTYNRLSTIEKAVESILVQRSNFCEIIILDDGSTDGTGQFIQERYPSVRYHWQQNSGVGAARNAGARLAEGEYLIFLDSDDVFAADSIQKYFEAISLNQAELIFGETLIRFDDGKEVLKRYNSSRDFIENRSLGMQLPGAFCMRKSVFMEIGGYDELIRFGENTELFWRLEARTIAKALVPQVMVIMFRKTSDRASVAPANLVSSNLYVMQKHEAYLTSKPLTYWYYLNVTAVGLAKINRRADAFKLLYKAIKLFPFRVESYFRSLLLLRGFRF